MLTKLQKDKKRTKQVRIDVELHKQLKFNAVSNNTLMSSLLNLIVKNYFEMPSNETKQYETNSE